MIIVKQENTVAKIKFHTFSGGEEHVNIEELYGVLFRKSSLVTIFARIDSSSELMRLLLVTDALRRMGIKDIELFMPYIPYARQDRVCANGDAFSLKVFANLINAQGYIEVIVVDSHSSVATALLDNVVELPQHSFVHEFYKVKDADLHYDYIIAPDAGASKKVSLFVQEYSKLRQIDSVQALKIREASTGNIVKTKLLVDDLSDKNCLIVDDICDGGRTFTELSKILIARGAKNVGLFVTHGIFSQGLDVLFENGIDDVYTTDSFEQKDPRALIIHKFFE